MSNVNFPSDKDKVSKLLGCSSVIEGCEVTIVGSDTISISSGRCLFNYIENGSLISYETVVPLLDNISVPVPSPAPPNGKISIFYVFIDNNFNVTFDADLSNSTEPNSRRIQVASVNVIGNTISSAINLTYVSTYNVP